MAHYVTEEALQNRIDKIKSGLQRWSLQCFDRACVFGEWAIGIEQNSVFKLSLPYRVNGDDEQRYWIEEI